MRTSVESESGVPEAARGPAAAWSRHLGVLALLAALFTAVVVQYSLQYGRLIFAAQPWEDCRYVGDALLRLNEFFEHGFGAAVRSYLSHPPVSPFSTYLGALGYAVFGPRDWAPYAANGVLILILLLYLDRRLSGLGAARKAIVFSFALLTPMAFSAVHEYRPDLAAGLFTAIGILAVTGARLDRLTFRQALGAGAFFGLALLAKPSIFPGTLVFLAGALAISWARAWREAALEKSGSPGGWRTCAARAVLIAAIAVAVSLVYFLAGFRQQWHYLVDALLSPHRRFWVLQGGLATHLGYYLFGPGGDAMFLGFRPVFAAVLLAGGAGAFLSRDCRKRDAVLWAFAALLLAYAVPALLPNKALFGNATFGWLVMLDACLILGAIFGLSSRGGPRSVTAFGMALLVGAGALSGFRWARWGDADDPAIRRSGEMLRELAGTLAAEARGGRGSVFFPTAGLLTQPGMAYLLARQHMGPDQISLATRVLEEDIRDYRADIRRADIVVVSDPGVGLLPYNMPSEKVQGPLLQYMRENSAFRLARQIGGPNEKSFYVFERDRPIREGMSVEALEPVSGAGSSQTFRLVVSHADGHRNFNGALLRFLGPGGQQCLIDYNHKNEAWIVSRGAAWSEELPAGKPGLLESSTCALDGSASSVEKSGTQLVLRFAIRFLPAFAGSHQVSAYAENKQGKGTGWITLGEWKSE